MKKQKSIRRPSIYLLLEAILEILNGVRDQSFATVANNDFIHIKLITYPVFSCNTLHIVIDLFPKHYIVILSSYSEIFESYGTL